MVGTFVLSLDTELIWGFLNSDNIHYYEKLALETKAIFPAFLDLLNKYEIKTTFAVVGHLMLDSCNAKDCSCQKFDKQITFAKDLVSKVKDRGHEIALHSFSHKQFDDLSEEDAEYEIKAASKAADLLGINITSMVFPWNKVDHLDLLKKYNISVYRGLDRCWFKDFPLLLQRPMHLLDYLLEITPPVYSVKKVNGLLSIPGSMLYLSMDGLRRFIPLRKRVNKAKKGIDKAVKENKVFHLWFHPINLVSNRGRMFKGLEEIIAYVAKKRTEGKLIVSTMGGLSRNENIRD